ncbi:5-deoxy-glucuronate isomerase [Paraburkholderia sp. BL10I2N1]|uniref:5-deoxy-glucuronate isomerase n=1 Tax=Paraburkholderia sp. BL10I2N1 TaxID=1938796 RepID=UPI00105DA75B|nr:5-deoxy-glucuronate isomerase [Paraburkholderia sp. BL10I2N1]TDN63174.1 5-deoxyglucuronate isomerase [Paraburkholderia sp. BL10I2N1]
MNLLVKGARNRRDLITVTPASAGWRHVGFEVKRLTPGETISLCEPDREICLVVLSGVVSVTAGEQQWNEIGMRTSVFDEHAPYAVYIPPRLQGEVIAHGAVELAICTAPAEGKLPARLIEPSSIKRSVRGVAANARYIADILPATEAAESLLVVEVRTPQSHSSSYPPHKHDTDAVPQESVLEETYYHRINPPQGFVFQRVYTDDRSLDVSMAVEDGDAVLVPRGYHPVVVPYGYESYYLNVMAGPTRQWCFKNDPAHEWLISGGPEQPDTRATSPRYVE